MADNSQYNLRIPVDLLARVKAAAIVGNTTATAFILDALRERLQPVAKVKVDGGERFPVRPAGSLLKGKAK